LNDAANLGARASAHETAVLDRLFALANNGGMHELAGIEAFVAVVERGSFTAAAKALQTAKSSVSEAVRALEERMGARLLGRTTRSVAPTEAGAAFYRSCRRLLDELQAARTEAQARHKSPAGTLRVAAPDGFAPRFIVPGLPAFRAAHPAIDIELVEGAEPAKLVDEQLDLAIRIVARPEPSLVVRRIATSRVVIVGAPAYLAAAGTPQKPQDILRHRLIGFSPLDWRDTWRLGKETVRVKPKLLTNSSESLRAAALAGLGLAAAPAWLVADAIVAGQLATVLDSHPPTAGGIYAVYLTNRLLTPRVRAFVDHLVCDLRSRGLKS
jgi:DNA-binding transcriptional LysR family regulator